MAPTTSQHPLLTLVLIARNEEEQIERCLRSVAPLAPQIVVVDTGSTDRTREVAGRLGAEVHRIDWRDDFSHARNEVLRHVRGEWVLWLDADEELLPESVPALQALLASEETAAAHLRIENRVGGKRIPFLVPRLWRHHAEIRFRDPVHEQVLWSILPQAERLGRKVVEAPQVVIIHHGYSARQVAQRGKESRNLRLLEKALRKSPQHPRVLFHYACALRESRRFPEAAASFRRWEPLAFGLPESEDHWVRLGLACYASCLIEIGDVQEALRVTELAVSEKGESRSLRAYRSQALLHLKRVSEAFEELCGALRISDAPGGAPEAVDFQPMLIPTLVADVYGALGRREEARARLREELGKRPEDPSPRFGLARLQLAEGDLSSAVEEYRKIVEASPEDLGALTCLSQLEIVRRLPLKAARYLSRASTLAPGRPDLARLLGEALLLAGEPERARDVWQAEATHSEVQGCLLLFTIPEGRSGLKKIDRETAAKLQSLLALVEKILTFAEPESEAVKAVLDCASAVPSSPPLRPLREELQRLLARRPYTSAEMRTG